MADTRQTVSYIKDAPTSTTTTPSDSSAPSTIQPISSPVQSLAESAVTNYSAPPETQPSLTTQEAVVLATNTRIPPTTNTVQEKPTSTSTAETKPLLINNLLIDPIAGTTTALTSTGKPSIGGGFGGSANETTGKATPKKSWIPIILIGIGAFILLKKKKQA